MATIIQQPESFSFSSDIDDIIFATSEERGDILLTVTAAGTNAAVTVLNETLYAIGGRITLCELGALIEPYVRQYQELTLACSFDDGTPVSITPVTVFFANADVGMSAASFVQSHFLTTLSGEKITSHLRDEFLYARGASSATITATVLLSSGTIQTLTASLSAEATNVVSRFRVSPDTVASAISLPTGATLLSYTITSGSREASFRVIEEVQPPAPSLIFVNSFGCDEIIHCIGTHKKESRFDRSQARILGLLSNYRVVEDRVFTANTGALNSPMADWADELFRSEDVRHWFDGAPGKNVVITDSKSELTNDDDFIPSYSFSYVYAQRIHNVLQPSHAGRIFDYTFDYTFN